MLHIVGGGPWRLSDDDTQMGGEAMRMWVSRKIDLHAAAEEAARQSVPNRMRIKRADLQKVWVRGEVPRLLVGDGEGGGTTDVTRDGQTSALPQRDLAGGGTSMGSSCKAARLTTNAHSNGQTIAPVEGSQADHSTSAGGASQQGTSSSSDGKTIGGICGEHLNWAGGSLVEERTPRSARGGPARQFRRQCRQSKGGGRLADAGMR